MNYKLIKKMQDYLLTQGYTQRDISNMTVTDLIATYHKEGGK